MMKCVCCGKDAINLFNVDNFGMCCEHCATVISMALEERETKEDESTYELLKECDGYVDIDDVQIPSNSLLFKINNHVFCIQTMFTKGEMEAYAATEVYKKNDNKDSKYHFEVFGPVDSKQALIFELISKTIDGVNNKSIEYESKYNIASIKQTGQMILEAINADNGEYGWKIDGKLYSPNQVAKLFSSYEGWQIFFQAMDRSDDVLKKDMFLIPSKLNDDFFVDELKELVMVFSDNNESKYISSKNIFGFNIFFAKLLEKLEFYFLHTPRGNGKIAGMKMISVLKDIGTNDDTFPDYQINSIQKVISTNEEFNHPEIK